MWRYFISLKLVWKYGMNWEQNCPMWDFHVFSFSIIWAYARVQMKHALSVSSDPRAAVGTNTTHTHTHTMYAWMFFYAWYVIYVKCRWELKGCSVWDYNPKPSLSPLQKWTCCVLVFILLAVLFEDVCLLLKMCQIPWMVMLQKRKINKRKKIFFSLFLNFSHIYNLHNNASGIRMHQN